MLVPTSDFIGVILKDIPLLSRHNEAASCLEKAPVHSLTHPLSYVISPVVLPVSQQRFSFSTLIIVVVVAKE